MAVCSVPICQHPPHPPWGGASDPSPPTGPSRAAPAEWWAMRFSARRKDRQERRRTPKRRRALQGFARPRSAIVARTAGAPYRRKRFRRGNMPGSKAVKERIEQLISQAPQLSSENDVSAQMAWLISAQLRRLRIFGQRDKLKANRSKGAKTWA